MLRRKKRGSLVSGVIYEDRERHLVIERSHSYTPVCIALVRANNSSALKSLAFYMLQVHAGVL
jgi:hypothetical protein